MATGSTKKTEPKVQTTFYFSSNDGIDCLRTYIDDCSESSLAFTDQEKLLAAANNGDDDEGMGPGQWVYRVTIEQIGVLKQNFRIDKE